MHVEQMTSLQRWLYAGLCVLLPVLWGLLMVGASNVLESALARRRVRRAPGTRAKQTEVLEYHI